MSLTEKEIRSMVECVLSHAVTESMHRLIILCETPEEVYSRIIPDVDYLTKFIMNEIEHARKEM